MSRAARYVLFASAAGLLGACTAVPNLGGPGGAGASSVSGTVSGPGLPTSQTKIGLYYGIPGTSDLSGAQVYTLSSGHFSVPLDNSQQVAILFAFQDLQNDNKVDAGDPDSYATSCSGCTYYKLANLGSGNWSITQYTQNGSNPVSGDLASANIAFNTGSNTASLASR